MTRLEDIKGGAFVRGIVPQHLVQVVSFDWIGQQALNVLYRDPNGAIAESTLYRDDEHRLSLEASGRLWSFDADGSLLRLVTEANRIKLAHYFDPYLAIHTSLVDPLPHQISAVYGEMLPRQPLRFLLADDPGAGKTIMSGLLMKELIARGDLERCLVVAPGTHPYPSMRTTSGLQSQLIAGSFSISVRKTSSMKRGHDQNGRRPLRSVHSPP
jgi:hypothetical protein